MKERVLATVLSFIWPGLGQFYNSQAKKGLLFSAVTITGLLLTGLTEIPLALILIVYGSFGLWAAWDAYTTAARKAFYQTFQ